MKQALPVAVKFLHKGNKELSRSVSSYLPLAAIEHPELLAGHIQPIIDSVIGGNYALARLLPQIYTLNPERINEHVMALANLLSQCDDTEKCSLLSLFKLVAARNGSNRSLILQPSLPQLLHCLNNPVTVGPTLEVLLEMSNDAKLLENHLDKIQESVTRSAVGTSGSSQGGSSNSKSCPGTAPQNAVTAAQIFRHVIQTSTIGVSTTKRDKSKQILLLRMIKLLDVASKDQSAQLQILREILSLAHHSPWLITSEVMFAISKSVNLSSSNFGGVGHAALNKLWDLCDGSGTPTGSSSAELLQTVSSPPPLGSSTSTSQSKTTRTSPLSTGKATLNYSILDGSTDKLISNPMGLSITRLANLPIPSSSASKQQPLQHQQPIQQQQQLGGGNPVVGAGLLVPSFSTYIPHTPSSTAAIHPVGLPTTIAINSCRSPTNNSNFSSIEYRKRGAGGGINITIPPVTAYQNRSASSISGLREDFGNHLNSLRTSQSSMTPSAAGSTNASTTAVVVPPPPHDLAWPTTGIRSPTKAYGQHHNLIGNSGTFSSSAASILSGHGLSSHNNFVSKLSTNQLAGSGFNNNNISYSIYLSNNNYNITSNSGFLTGKTNPNGSSSHHYNNYNAHPQHHYGGGSSGSGATKLQNGHHHQKMQPLSPTGDAHHQLVNSVMSQPDLRMSNPKELQISSGVGGGIVGHPVGGGMSHMSLIQSSSGENNQSGSENVGTPSSITASPANHHSASSGPLTQISVFEPFPMRDVVQHFCEKHLEKIKGYMEKITVRIPLPVKCTIEERKSRKNAKLHFACQFQTEHCIYSGTRLFSMKTRYPRIWIHLMFLALQARSTTQALSTRENSVSSLKNCWEILKCENKSFLTIVTSAFPSTRDQDCLLLELRNAGFFDLFEFNALKAQWGCFFCNHPGRALQFLTSEQPILEGCLKEKKGKWKLFKRWRTRYFTLSGGQLMARGNDSTSTLNLHQILSVRVTRGQRQIPKAFEIFTQDKKVVLKPKDGKNANEWVQCLSVLVARNEAGGGLGSDSLSTGFNSCYPSQIQLSKAVSVNGFRTEV